MRILRIIASVNPTGGGPIAGLKLSTQELTKSGHTTTIVTLDRPDAPHVDIQRRNIGAEIVPLGPGRFRFRYTPKLVEWLSHQKGKFDAAVIHGLWHYSSMGGGKGLEKAEIPYVLYPHGMMDPYFAKADPKKFRVKRLVWSLAQGRVLRNASEVLFTSERERELAIQTFPKPTFRSRAVAYGAERPSPADAEGKAAFRAMLPDLGERRYLLYLSRIHAKKGGDLLIESFARIAGSYPDLDLVMAGPEHDDFGRRLRERATALGLTSRIHWPGMVTSGAKAAAFEGAEAFVLPSFQENFGIAVAEALAYGLPVLISDQVNICDEVTAANAGLVAPVTPDGVDRLLSDWAQTPAEARMAMSEAARNLFESRFTAEAAAQDLEAALKRAAGNAK